MRRSGAKALRREWTGRGRILRVEDRKRSGVIHEENAALNREFRRAVLQRALENDVPLELPLARQVGLPAYDA